MKQSDGNQKIQLTVKKWETGREIIWETDLDRNCSKVGNGKIGFVHEFRSRSSSFSLTGLETVFACYSSKHQFESRFVELITKAQLLVQQSLTTCVGNSKTLGESNFLTHETA